MKSPQTTIRNEKNPTTQYGWVGRKNNIPNTLAKEDLRNEHNQLISETYSFAGLKIFNTKVNTCLHSLAAVGGEK